MRKLNVGEIIGVVLAVVLIVLIFGQTYISGTTPIETNIPNIDGSSATSGGLVIEDIVVGTGEAVANGDLAVVHYTGTLEDGTKFDSSLDRGEPFGFIVGQGRVISGWEQGVIGMKEGGKRRLIIPPELAYGPTGAGNGVIPPNAKLFFDIELIQVERPPAE
ncbi:MAG: hypothetical protein A2928_02895 [Candidatus Taylorbacteria bacterium RIFCSPLOWO2_01_FULL_45_15b]|uniref:Peptidyl-prolyl cis-trans isomerase n=1 Tax=Candidatus Taylorbacteria bacterium RIFCSPLOWO2_01_FULL_45_15b TaxID=1802319 RepID=A0A1G2NFA1_9BACT|nr:MAG: hypothetical protein A2928_02895 [Candidatus Taylorbacteria bacterium RIFCSPLOWO2_01_FULL_45_15b]